MPITKEVSQKLQDLKEEACLTFEQIGEEVGSSSANVRRYILGETKVPDRQLLYAIIRAVGGDPEEILGIKKPEQQQSLSAADEVLLGIMEQRYKEQLANLKEAYDTAVHAKTELIAELRSERKILRIAIVVLVITLILLMTTYRFIG